MAAILPLPQTSKWAKREKQPPIRQGNQASRPREYLTPDEVERIVVAARHEGGRLANRNALLIMIAYRHGFRASELIALRWDQIDLKAGMLHVAEKWPRNFGQCDKWNQRAKSLAAEGWARRSLRWSSKQGGGQAARRRRSSKPA